ncbi:hypothetical protein [Bacillus pseudomycoides]|uniref:Uncharacterized protein n=1 Tax=Bacillus pseudomycoides TaxID=64104 RepID=A0A2C3WR10_9BACI|nr:hypothetical protein [Bacillus pseudomycoides]PDY47972.1 hypothetical protein CON79_06745 [Bacillus pseudomycoides]PEA82689.1 hypothetical protein CON99_15705 [Bacillus pseudomycoides]PEI32174.1 hypothetical protein CN620_28545 [Bacillus pseudomycoides]PEJ66897.1 hypothetical protein CN680_27715 [Bacillus pseudomycoides]PEM14686.1 hypothetical protein CN628_17990 [Bacillus pseudomycoides]
MAIDTNIKTDYFKLYIDYEEELDLTSFIKILEALNNINYEVCEELGLEYTDHKLKIRSIYSGSIWIEFVTLVANAPANIIYSALGSALFASVPFIKNKLREKQDNKKLKKKTKNNKNDLDNNQIKYVSLDNAERDTEFVKKISDSIDILKKQKLSYDALWKLRDLKRVIPLHGGGKIALHIESYQNMLNHLEKLETEAPELFDKKIPGNLSKFKQQIINIISEDSKTIIKTLEPSDAEPFVIINHGSLGIEPPDYIEKSLGKSISNFVEEVWDNKQIKKCSILIDTESGRELNIEIKDQNDHL